MTAGKKLMSPSTVSKFGVFLPLKNSNTSSLNITEKGRISELRGSDRAGWSKGKVCKRTVRQEHLIHSAHKLSKACSVSGYCGQEKLKC